MSCILNIETSTDVCSVAISDSGQVIFNQEDHSGPNHAVKLGVCMLMRLWIFSILMVFH